MSAYKNGSLSNVSGTERAISLFTGSWLLYDSLKKEKKNLPEALLAGFLLFRGVTGYCPVSDGLERSKDKIKGQNITIKTSVIVNRPRREVYAFWHNLENLPLFMKHLKSVKMVDNKISEWTATIPNGLIEIKWKAEMVKDEVYQHIGWASLPGSRIENVGNVKFLDGPNGSTEVHVAISYHAPLGLAGESIGRLLTPALERLIHEDIEGFKKYMEEDTLPF
jgi:uncharacterized membrane protein